MTGRVRVPALALHRASVDQAASRGLTNLRGIALIGGLCVCICNRVPLDGSRELVAFMDGFAASARTTT
jgi:phosphoserine aminotransferase